MAGSMPTYDYEVERDALVRKQKIADAMLSQSLSPMEIQQVGPVAAQVNPWQGVAKVLQGYMAGRESDGIKAEKDALSERYKSDLSSGMNDFMRVSQGYAAPESPSEGAPMVQVPGDKRRAIMEAIASNHPVLQQLGMKQLEALNKGEDLGEVGGVVYDKGTRSIVNLGGPKPTQKVIDGDLYELNPSTSQWKKLDNSPRITTNVSANPVIMGQKEGMKTWFESTGKQVDAMGKAAAQATEMMPQIQRLEELNNAGTFSNITANPAAFVSNLGQVMGAKVDVTKLKNTEEFNATATKLWVDMIQASGGARGWTEPETKKIEKVLPNVNTSPQARADLIQLMKEKAKRNVDTYRKANQSFARAVKMDDPEIFAKEFEDIYVSPVPHEATSAPVGKGKTVKWGDL